MRAVFFHFFYLGGEVEGGRVAGMTNRGNGTSTFPGRSAFAFNLLSHAGCVTVFSSSHVVSPTHSYPSNTLLSTTRDNSGILIPIRILYLVNKQVQHDTIY